MDFKTEGREGAALLLLLLLLQLLPQLLLLLQNTQDCQEASLEAQGLLSVPRPYRSPSFSLCVPIVYHGFDPKPHSLKMFALSVIFKFFCLGF